MDWKEKIAEGMRLIVEGCKENPDWTRCKECPFDTHCTSIFTDDENDLETPDSWE